MIKQISIGLLLGICATLIFVQYDPWVHAQVGNFFIYTLSKTFDCEVRGTVRTVNFMSPEILFDDFSMRQKKEGAPAWQWHAKIYRTGFSWLELVVHGSIRLWAVIHDLEVASNIENNKLAIQPHLNDLLAAPDFPIPLSLHDGYIHNGVFKLQHDEGDAFFAWNMMSHRVGNHARSYITITDGSLTMRKINMLDQTSGSLVFDTYDDGTLAMQLNCQAHVSKLGDHPAVTLKGSWNKDSGRFSLESFDKSLLIDPIIVTEKQGKSWIEMQGRLPAGYACFLATRNRALLSGDCLISLKGTFDTPSFLEGQIIGEHICHPLIAQEMMWSSSFHRRDLKWFGAVDIRLPKHMALQGSFEWDEKEDSGEVKLTNANNVSIPSYPHSKVHKQKLALNINATKETITARMTCDVHNELHKTVLAIQSDITGDRATGAYTIQGNGLDFVFEGTGCATHYPYVNKLCYYQDKNNPSIKLVHNDEAQRYEGMIQIPALRALVYHLSGYDVQGEGCFEFRTNYRDVLTTQFHLKNGTIRLPGTFNFVNGIDGLVSVDLNNNVITLEDISCRLHTGSVSLERGALFLDSTGALSFCHVPILFDHCLLNLKRDLFAMVSGAVSFSKQANKIPLVKGNLFLDRSQLKENIFSERFQKNLFQVTDTMQTTHGVALACDLHVVTKDPIRIETGFLNAQAQVDISIQKEMSEPEITGSIGVLSGSLGFPYKPLHISRGKVLFVKDQPLNPFVELVAKNSFKQHNITLQVSGSLRDHFVLLESTPPLTDEQIIGLLLAGSHEESLSAVIPTLLVQNVTNVIFSANQSGFLDQYVKPWLKQMNVHFVPKFSEESGRGGLRGALEIDVNERWRALIEKNFSLTEDTRFELEYMLSDDVRFRIIRDERCDIGGEVEMKWKF